MERSPASQAVEQLSRAAATADEVRVLRPQAASLAVHPQAFAYGESSTSTSPVQLIRESQAHTHRSPTPLQNWSRLLGWQQLPGKPARRASLRIRSTLLLLLHILPSDSTAGRQLVPLRMALARSCDAQPLTFLPATLHFQAGLWAGFANRYLGERRTLTYRSILQQAAKLQQQPRSL